MREREGEVLGSLIENLLRERVAILDGFGKVLRFGAGAFADQFGKNTVRFRDNALPNALIHRPAGAAFFHDSATFIEPNVPDLRFARDIAMIYLFRNYETAPDAASERYVKHGVA